MHLQGRIAYHLIFIAAIACLIVFKWSDLSLPYFWDELGVYTQAADYQVQHGISLAPASVPPVLSRGHPLLFTCMNAIVRRVFGEQVMVAHVFCFFIAVLLLAVIYLKVSLLNSIHISLLWRGKYIRGRGVGQMLFGIIQLTSQGHAWNCSLWYDRVT